jgi:hypothetical protein
MDKNKYYNQAVACVKDHLLPVQKEMYERAGKDFDVIYGSLMNNDMYFGSIIEPRHVYELGYHSVPARKRWTEVEILSTILRGGDKCRFKIVVE